MMVEYDFDQLIYWLQNMMRVQKADDDEIQRMMAWCSSNI